MKRILLIISIFLIPALCFGQIESQDYEKAVDFLEGGSVLENWFMKEFLNGYRNILLKNMGSFIGISKMIGGSFAIVYFSIKAYELMVGDKEFQILPLLRPFSYCLLILNWGAFIAMIDAPMSSLWNKAADQYEQTIPENRSLRISRAKYQRLLVESLFKEQAELDIASQTAEKSFWDDPTGVAKDAVVDAVLKPLIEWKYRLNISMQQLFTQLLELVSLWILRIMVYLVFALQVVYTGVLVTLGPISVAFSILPMFKDAFKTWLARYLSVQFYLVVAFLVLTVGSSLQTIAMSHEISRYSSLISLDGTVVDMQKIMWLQSNGILSFGTVIVSFLVSAAAMLSVPKISTWIISTAGTAGTMGGASRAATMLITKGKK